MHSGTYVDRLMDRGISPLDTKDILNGVVGFVIKRARDLGINVESEVKG